MSDPKSDSDAGAPESRPEKEYQDPHYHDEEPELDEGGSHRPRWPGKRKPNRLRLPKRHYED
jgi:hypothetical protein